MCIYKDNGYEDRQDYLDSIAEDYGVDRFFVTEIASMLGPSEDFDGLLTTLEDYSYMEEMECE